MAESAEDIASRVTRTLRRRVLEALADRESSLDQTYQEIGARVRRELRAVGFTEAQVADVVRRAFEDTRARRIATIEAAIEEGAREGAQGDRLLVRAVFGGRREAAVDAGETLEEGEEPPGVRFATGADAMASAGARIRGETAIDSIPLSRRVWGSDRTAVEGLRRQIVASVRHGEGVQRVAERLLDAAATDDGPTLRVRIPRHVEELRDAARENVRDPLTGEVLPSPAYTEAAGRWRSRIAALGEIDRAAGTAHGAYTIRSATQELRDRLATAAPENVDALVDRWVLDRARYQARLVARTETVEAFRETMIESTRGKPWVVGYRWELSNRHPVPDECDLYARQNLHGLGAGGYPPDRIPPRHPADLCTITPIADRAHFARARARRNGDPEPPRPWEDPNLRTAADVVREAGPAWGRRAIGPTRLRLLEEGHDVFSRDGTPIPVHMLTGQPAPFRRSGPAVDVARLVREDRAALVQPFPAAPRLAPGATGRRGARGP